MGRPIHHDVLWIIVRLSTIMSARTIAMYTGVSKRKVEQVLSTFRDNGTVEVRPGARGKGYHKLCDQDVQVSVFYHVSHINTDLWIL